MRHYRIDLSFNRVIEKDKSPECDSYDPYVEEHNRLGAFPANVNFRITA